MSEISKAEFKDIAESNSICEYLGDITQAGERRLYYRIAEVPSIGYKLVYIVD